MHPILHKPSEVESCEKWRQVIVHLYRIIRLNIQWFTLQYNGINSSCSPVSVVQGHFILYLLCHIKTVILPQLASNNSNFEYVHLRICTFEVSTVSIILVEHPNLQIYHPNTFKIYVWHQHWVSMIRSGTHWSVYYQIEIFYICTLKVGMLNC